MYTVYILSCSDDTYHTGITKNIKDRVTYHEKGENPDAYTFTRLPVRLEFEKVIESLHSAFEYNQHLQKLSSAKIKQVISGKLLIEVSQRPETVKKDSSTAVTSVVLPSTYLGNLAYYADLKNASEIRLDLNELFQKQTYRSRCTILTANGTQHLVVPVIRPNGKNTPMSDIRISYAENWQKDHIKAIESAYRRAPYYEFYAEELFTILEKKYERLVDLNNALMRFILHSFSLNCEIAEASEDEKSDLNAKINMTPKNRLDYSGKPYRQVFSNDAFESNLSVIDWLFNNGGSSATLL